MTSWMDSPGDRYGASLRATTQPATSDATATTTVAPVLTPSVAGFLSPSDPMFWFGVIAAATVGLMAYSTAVPVKV